MAEEYKFKIGRFHPTTLPMHRLAEYVKDLSLLFGSQEFVHLIRVDEGSAVPNIFVQSQHTKKVDQRLMSVRDRKGPDAAMRAYDSIDDRLAEDNTSATLRSPSGITLSFPGHLRDKETVLGPVKEEGTIEGEIVEISGRDNSISLYLKDGEMLHRCSASRDQGREWGKHIFAMVRITGIGTWRRSESGVWKLMKFDAEKLHPLRNDTLRESIQRIRSLAPKDMPDPIVYLAEMNTEEPR